MSHIPVHLLPHLLPAAPSAAGANPPKHLDGTLLGDYGFDPLRLGSKDKDVLKYYREVGAAPC